MFSFDYLENIWNSIDKKIFQERQRYAQIYEIIDKYISANVEDHNSAIMIGGTMGIDLLLKKERGIDDFQYELYSETEFIHANNLTNVIEEANVNIGSPFIVSMKSTIPNIKYQIFVDNRIMVTIYKLPKNSYDLILPVKVNTFNNKHEVLVLSPEIQLIDIYRDLYLPSRADEWENTLYDETKLFLHLKQRIDKRSDLVQPTTGGEEFSIEDRRKLLKALLKEFVIDNPNVALVGEYACSIILETTINTNVLQVISQNYIEEDFIQISNIITRCLGKEIPICKLIRDLHIMQDFRLRRITIKIGSAETCQKEIMYIYNSAHYDLIPINNCQYKDHKLNLGNPFVILRFLLIEFWIIRWIRQLGSINEQFAHERLNSILNTLVKLRSSMAKAEFIQKRKIININPELFDSLTHPTLRIFPSESKDYIGFYDDENISQKIIIKDLNRKFFDYYPYDYMKKNNMYRKI